MWALRKTANHLRAHGKYHNALKASTGRLENWTGNATHLSFIGKSSEDNVVGLFETNGSAPARGISHCQYPRLPHLGRGLASQPGAGDKYVPDAPEEGFSELDSAPSCNNGEAEEHWVSEDEFSEHTPGNSAEADADPYLSDAEVEKEEVHNASRLYQTVLSCEYYALSTSLEQWLADGNDLTREEVITTFVQLRKRRMFRHLLKVSDWLEVKKPFEMNERDYATRLDLIAKVLGISKAEKYLASIPLDMRGVRVYRSLLANCSFARNVKKTEEIFNKMKDEGFLLTAFDYNKLLWIYSRLDMKKILFVVKMMKDQGIKPSTSTYRILIDVKGRIGDIGGMEEVVKNMKSEHIEPDSESLALIARHYITAGLAEKAEVVLKDLQNNSLKDKQSVLKMLLPLYADLGKAAEVESIWKDLESSPNLQLDGYAAGVVAWGKLGKVEKAEITFETLLTSGRKVSAKHYNVLLDVYADHHLLLKGKELVKRMSDNGCKIGPTTWDALVRLFVNAGELEKADSILFKACNQNQLKPMYRTLVTILEKYAEKGDIANSENIFDRMRQAGYPARARAFEFLLQAYAKARLPAYGFRERMKADKIFPYGRLNNLLQQVDAFKKDTQQEILD